MEELTSKSQMEKIRDFEKGFFATHLINLGAKLGVFEILKGAEEGLTVKKLASELGLHEPYLKIWCQTAYFFQILDCNKEGKFIFQPYLNEILGDKTSVKNYLANIALSVDLVGQSMDAAPEYYRSGKIIESYKSPEESEYAYETTKNMHFAYIFMIFPKNDHLNQMLVNGIKFLDIGCGNGNLVIQLAQAYQNSTFVGINPDNFGIIEGKKKISQQQLKGKVSVQNIGGHQLTYSNEFDLINMALTLHEIIPPDHRPIVLEKAYEALKPGGFLMILDFPYPSKIDDFRNSMYDMGILDQFFETVIGTVHLTTEEQTEILTRVGFKDIKRMNIGKGMFEFVTATK